MAAPSSSSGPPWLVHFGPLRRLVVFLLGVATVVDALATTEQRVGELLVGLALLGIIPIDGLLDRLPLRPHRRNGDRSTPDR